MRNWCAAFAMGALLASPLSAQQNSGAGDDTANAARKSVASSKAAGSGKALATKDVFALPAMPRRS